MTVNNESVLNHEKLNTQLPGRNKKKKRVPMCDLKYFQKVETNSMTKWHFRRLDLKLREKVSYG